MNNRQHDNEFQQKEGQAILVIEYTDSSRSFVHVSSNIELLFKHVRLQLRHNPEKIRSIRVTPVHKHSIV